MKMKKILNYKEKKIFKPILYLPKKNIILVFLFFFFLQTLLTMGILIYIYIYKKTEMGVRMNINGSWSKMVLW